MKVKEEGEMCSNQSQLITITEQHIKLFDKRPTGDWFRRQEFTFAIGTVSVSAEDKELIFNCSPKINDFLSQGTKDCISECDANAALTSE